MTSSASGLLAALAATLATVAAPLVPPPVYAPAAIEARVLAGVAQRWGVDADRVRVAWGRMPAGADAAAESALELLGRGSDGWFAVVLRPSAGEPLALRVRAGVMTESAVAEHALAPGTTLAAADVRREPRLTWGPPRTEVPVGAGWVARRALVAGDPLVWPAVAPPSLVGAGDPVQLVWARGAVRVTREGVALNAATAGGTVHVRASSGGGRFRGVATAPRTVSLNDGGRP